MIGWGAAVAHSEDGVSKNEGGQKDEKEVEYWVGSGNRRGLADRRSRSRAGLAVWSGGPEPASGATDRQAEDSGSYAADAGRFATGERGRRCRVQSVSSH